MYFFFPSVYSQHKIYCRKHSYFNRFSKLRLGKVYSFSGIQSNMHFLPTLKRSENELKSYVYCVCFVRVGKCFCVAPAFLDILYS